MNNSIESFDMAEFIELIRKNNFSIAVKNMHISDQSHSEAPEYKPLIFWPDSKLQSDRVLQLQYYKQTSQYE